MTRYIYLLIILIALNACSISNRIVETDDPYKEIRSIHLQQYPSAYSAEKVSRTSWKSYHFTTELFSDLNSVKKPEVRIKFQLTTGIRADELDSVLYLRLDQEKIRLVSVDYKYKQFEHSSTSTTSTTTTSVEKKTPEKLVTATKVTEKPAEKVNTTTSHTTTVENGTYQLMARQFIIPENLWVAIVHSGEIHYRLYFGREGIDIELTNAEANKVKEFFSRIIRYSEANFPVTPEGQMKW